MRRIIVLIVVVVIVFRCHASEKLQEAIFLAAELEIFLANCLSFKYVISQ